MLLNRHIAKEYNLMTKYIIKRLVGMIPTLFIIVTLSFFIVRIAPGGPFDGERALPEAVKRNIEAKYHMDEPLIVQYGRYMFDVIRGDLGPSYKYKDYDVNTLIAVSLPNSIILGCMAMGVALIFGIYIRIICPGDGQQLFAPFLQQVFCMTLGWFPTTGWFMNDAPLRTMVLPTVALSFAYYADIARLTRSSMVETLRSDYIRTARAKGMKNSTIVFKHAMKGAMLPVVSYLGPAFAGILTGSIVVEQVFLVPGLGKFFVQSSFNRDYTLIVGVVIVYSVILIVMNFIVDIVYAYLDPRISYK